MGAGLLDQVLIAIANAGKTLLGLVLLDRPSAGLMVLALGVGTFAMYLNRAFVGDVLIALASRYDGEERAGLVRDGMATALVAGVGGAAIFVLLWWTWADLRFLIWIAPFLPFVMLHDTARCAELAARRPQGALVIDLVWVATQAVVVVALIATDAVTAGSLLAAWGVGAIAGTVTAAARGRGAIRPGSPRRWMAKTRHLAGWFTATAVIGQVHTQAVNFLVAGRLSTAEVAGLRFTQITLMQPVQNLITAVQGLLVPRASRKAHRGEDLRRETLRGAGAAAVLGALYVAVAWPVASALLVRSTKYADIAPLALPVTVQAAMYLVQLPFAAAMLGQHRAKALFVQYVIFSATGLTGLMIGAATHGLLGAVWGLAAGTFVGLIVMMSVFLWPGRAAGGAAAPEAATPAETSHSP